MAMKKYTSPAKATVFTGQAAEVVNKHLAKTGKALSEFNEDELIAFNQDLEKAEEKDAELAKVAEKRAAAEAKAAAEKTDAEE